MAEGTPILELERAEPASVDDSISPVSLRLMQGEFVLIDARGSGRVEMLADLCCGIQPLVQGQVRFLGRDWTKIPHLYADAMRGRIGRVVARGGWIGFLDMATNIMLPLLHHTRRDPATIREQASELARHFGLPGLPLGRPSELSGPDLARAACVRALLCEPVLLLLESPIQAQYGAAVGAHHFRFIGLEIVGPANNTDLVNLMELGTTDSVQNTLAMMPHDFVIDRCYLHPNANTAQVRRAA